MRYLPHTDADRAAMLRTIGAGNVDELFRDIPEAARIDGIAGLKDHKGEAEVERIMARLAARNVSAGSVPFFLGAGAYKHHVPAAVDHLIQRGEFLTSYTPYQPEVAQGTLQYLFEFQTQVALLTGMEVANASMYDGSTACAEAVAMANRVTGRSVAVLSDTLHPHYREVVETQGRWMGYEVVNSTAMDDRASCVVVQYPGFFGDIPDIAAIADAAHGNGALLIVVVTEIVALGLLPPPGELGADVVVAEGQSLGNGLNFGGPYIGLFATRHKFLRQMPGRLCGETVDADGRRGFVLTLSTREQHIRREKATSNICTNSGLCALAFTIHLSLLGEEGLRTLAALNHESACRTADRIAPIAGVKVLSGSFFNEFTVELPRPAAEIVDALAERDVLGGVPLSRLFPGEADKANLLLVASTEMVTDTDREAFAVALEAVLA